MIFKAPQLTISPVTENPLSVRPERRVLSLSKGPKSKDGIYKRYLKMQAYKHFAKENRINSDLSFFEGSFDFGAKRLRSGRTARGQEPILREGYLSNALETEDRP